MGVQDKVCIITDGGSGIGRSAALMLAQQGAKIAWWPHRSQGGSGAR